MRKCLPLGLIFVIGSILCVSSFSACVAIHADPTQIDLLPTTTYLGENLLGTSEGTFQLSSAQWHGIGDDWRLYDHTPQNPSGTPLTIDQLLQAWQQNIDDHMRAYGFNVVRLAFSFLDSGGVTHNTFNSELNDVLALFSRNGIGVILDLHDWADMPNFFGSADWLKDWANLAQTYKNDTRIIAYEIFNEPFGPNNPPGTSRIDNWDPSVTGGGCGIPYNNTGKSVKDALAECVDAIRATGDNHTIIYPDPWYFNGGNELWHPEWFSNSTDNRPNIVVTFHDWFESPTLQTEANFSTWWNNLQQEMTLWKEYFPIWIGEFGISLAANNTDFQQKINAGIINWTVTNHVGFSLWTARSNPTDLEQQWSFNEKALQASAYAPSYTLADFVTFARAYGSNRTDSNWNPNCDLNNDGQVDLIDLVILATHYN